MLAKITLLFLVLSETFQKKLELFKNDNLDVIFANVCYRDAFLFFNQILHALLYHNALLLCEN